MLLYCLLQFKLTRIPAPTTHWSGVFRSNALFCDINNGFNGNSHYNLTGIDVIFFQQPVLLYITIEAPTIRNEKSLIRFQKWLKFTIGLFLREVISMQSNFNSLQKPYQMSGSIFDEQ